MFRYLLLVSVYAITVLCANYTLPLKDPNGSDPFIVYYEDDYYLLTTTWTDVEITRAQTLDGLRTGEIKTIYTSSESTRCCKVWAPEVHEIDGTWYVYFTAGPSSGYTEQHVHVMKGGATPWDDFTYVSQLTPEFGLDGTLLRISSDIYFVWSCLDNNVTYPSLCIADLTNPYTIGTSYIISEPTESWEQMGSPVCEGPAALYHNDGVWLAYSASACSTRYYALGLLTWNGEDPLQASSWSKSGPVFTSANGNYGPGHNGFFNSPDGTQVWNVYHATSNRGGNCNGQRYTMAQVMNWNDDGTPDFGEPVPVGESLEGPSGE